MQPPQLKAEVVVVVSEAQRLRDYLFYSPGACYARTDALLDGQGYQSLQVRMRALVELTQTVMRLLHELAQLLNVLLAGATLQLLAYLTKFDNTSGLCRR